MDGKYKEGEPLQRLPVILEFKIKHNPGTEEHLKKLILLNDHYVNKDDVREENGNIVISI